MIFKFKYCKFNCLQNKFLKEIILDEMSLLIKI